MAGSILPAFVEQNNQGRNRLWAFLKFSILRSEFSILEIISQLTGRWQPRPPLHPFCLPPIRCLDCGLDKLNTTNAHVLKVPSGQIGSAWEWYHWIGIKKDINRYMIFFWSWIFEKSSKIWAASYKNESNPRLAGTTVCLESFLPIAWRTFICWKNPKCCSILVWIADCWFSSSILLTSGNPKNNCWLSRKVRQKRSRFVTIQPRDLNKEDD